MYKLSEVVKLLGVKPETLCTWKESGFLLPSRVSAEGYWFYSKEKIAELLVNKRRRLALCWCVDDMRWFRLNGYGVEEVLEFIENPEESMVKLFEGVLYGYTDTVVAMDENFLYFPLIKNLCESRNLWLIVLESEEGE